MIRLYCQLMPRMSSRGGRSHEPYGSWRRPTRPLRLASPLASLRGRRAKHGGRAWRSSEFNVLSGQSGFSLLEVLAAMGIFMVCFATIAGMHTFGSGLGRRAREMTVASMLARYKINEIQLELEKDIAKGETPSEDKSMEGDFSDIDDSGGKKKYEKYRWQATVKKVEIPVPPEVGGGEGEEAPEGEGGEAAAAGADQMLQVFKMISEAIAEATREIAVEISWGEGKRDKLPVTTHIVIMK